MAYGIQILILGLYSVLNLAMTPIYEGFVHSWVAVYKSKEEGKGNWTLGKAPQECQGIE